MTTAAGTSDSTLLIVLNIIATTLSLIGSLWMILVCIGGRAKFTIALAFILAIGFSDFFYSISNIMAAFGTQQEDTLCRTEGVIRETFLFLSLYFATCTAILCYRDTKYGPSFHPRIFFAKTMAIGIALALCISIPPLYMTQFTYMRRGLFCWIVYYDEKNDNLNMVALVIYQGIPLIFGSIISTVGYYKALKKIQQLQEEILGWSSVDIYKLLWYPVVLFIIFVPCFVDNIIQAYVSNTNLLIPLEAVHIVLTHSIGFVDALVYGVQRRAYNTSLKEEHSLQQGQFNRHDLSDSIIGDLTKEISPAKY